jgi:hypothetical protein
MRAQAAPPAHSFLNSQPGIIGCAQQGIGADRRLCRQGFASLRKTAAAAMPLPGVFLQEYQDLRNQMDHANHKLQAESKRSEGDAAPVVGRSETLIITMCLAVRLFCW